MLPANHPATMPTIMMTMRLSFERCIRGSFEGISCLGATSEGCLHNPVLANHRVVQRAVIPRAAGRRQLLLLRLFDRAEIRIWSNTGHTGGGGSSRRFEASALRAACFRLAGAWPIVEGQILPTHRRSAHTLALGKSR